MGIRVQVIVEPRPVRDRDRRWVRRGVAVAAVALGAGLLAGVSQATAPPTTDVRFTPVTNYKVLNNTYIAANAVRNVIVIGGATPVPTNATTVRMTVTVKGTKAGTLSFYPTGNPAGTTGQTVSWNPNQTVTATVVSDVGENESITVKNTSLASATVLATLTGYSTEVEADDISGAGGSAGQTIINDGNGGAQWGHATRAWSFQGVESYPLTTGGGAVALLNVPPGNYSARFTGSLDIWQAAGPVQVQCTLRSTEGTDNVVHIVTISPTVVRQDTVVIEMLLSLNGLASIYTTCRGSANGSRIFYPTLVVTAIGSVSIN